MRVVDKPRDNGLGRSILNATNSPSNSKVASMTHCVRCDTPMIRLPNTETEDIEGCILITDVVMLECPFCSAWIKWGMPRLHPQEVSHG
jgi:hypothetical protein